MVVLPHEELEDAGSKLGAARVLAWGKAQAVIDAGLDPHEAEILMQDDPLTGDIFITAVRR